MISQLSDEWMAQRRGKATGSRIADIVAKTRNGYGASRANYEAQLICERLTGVTADSYSNAAMQWGIETEPEARSAYEFLRDVDVQEVGFIDHPSIAMTGASPDGLVEDQGLIEIKCPQSATHIATLLGATVHKKYITQIQWQIACTQRQWCDFASFDPRMPEGMKMFIKRIERDDELIAELEKEVRQFLDEVAGKVSKLKTIYGE